MYIYIYIYMFVSYMCIYLYRYMSLYNPKLKAPSLYIHADQYVYIHIRIHIHIPGLAGTDLEHPIAGAELARLCERHNDTGKPTFGSKGEIESSHHILTKRSLVD